MMAGWTKHQGSLVALPLENVDTDQIIPARFMSTPRSEGYGGFLFHDLSRDADGRHAPDFPVKTPNSATVLIAGRNFGCGSSREAAVYALADAGFRAVFAPGFGDIFAANAVNNGLLPGCVSEDSIDALAAQASVANSMATVDLEDSKVIVADLKVDFQVDPVWRTKLMNGWDDIDLTKTTEARISAYRKRLEQSSPWIWRAG